MGNFSRRDRALYLLFILQQLIDSFAHTLRTARLSFDAFHRHLPCPARAVLDELTLAVLAHLLTGFLGDAILFAGKIAIRWMSWWVLP